MQRICKIRKASWSAGRSTAWDQSWDRVSEERAIRARLLREELRWYHDNFNTPDDLSI